MTGKRNTKKSAAGAGNAARAKAGNSTSRSKTAGVKTRAARAKATNAKRPARPKAAGAGGTTRRATSTSTRKHTTRPAQAKKATGAALALKRKKRTVRIIAIALAVVVAIACIWRIGTWHVFDAKYADCEKWRDVATQACIDCELGEQWTDAVLAAMVVESSGDLAVESVLGVKNDIMQAAEGAWGWIVIDGWPERGLEAETPQASIYAGVLEFKQNLELWNSYLEGITPEQPEKVQLVIQGYNFGADGWFRWCEDNEVRAYDVDIARRYSDEEMPSDAKGTPTHAAKWLDAYERIRSDHAAATG